MILLLLYCAISLICLSLIIAVIAGGYALHSLLMDIEEMEASRNGAH